MAEIIDNNSNLNNETLFFTRFAENEINNGNVEKAIDILQNGIHKFSNYPSSYLLYGEALLTIGKVHEAKNAFQTGIDLIGFQDTSDYYLNLIPDTDENIPPENIEVPPVNEDNSLENVDALAEIENKPAENENELVELADQLSNAKMDIPHTQSAPPEIKKDVENDSSFSPGRSLVSETLARIYFSQENYSEAKEIYETLIQIQPEREDYYQRKLEEIEMKIGT